MAGIKVVVNGALGKMGKEVVSAMCKAPDMDPVGAVDIATTEDYMSLPDGSGLIPLSKDLDAMIIRCKPQVVIDFSNAQSALHVLRTATPRGVCSVIGSTGITDAIIQEARTLADKHKVGIIIAPNFALGAVLLIHLAGLVGKFFDYADLTEIHHETKIDAPSGTSLAIAKALAESKGGTFKSPKPEKETLAGTRGGEFKGVNIHSGRMPGKMAYHNLILGTQGQTLTISHDTINRECYMPGVTIAVREVVKSKGLTVGLDKVLGL